MSGLYATLNSTVKAISAHSRAIETVGKNLANVNNTSYARQRVVYGDRGTVVTADGAESLGLEALGVEQMRDTLLDRQVAREISLKSSYEAEQSAYQRAQAGLGQGVDTTTATGSASTTDSGIGAALDNFFNSFQSLASSPTDDGVKTSLLENAQILTDRLQLADQRLNQVQTDLDSQVTSDVSKVNSLLSTISDLNTQIARFEINSPGSAVDLRDQRQARLEELSAKMPVTISDNSDGTWTLSGKDTSGSAVPLLDETGVQGAVAFNGSAITAGASGATVSLASGSIYGSLTARDGAVQDLRNNLDALAKQLVTSVNGVYATAGGGDFFNSSGTAAGSISLASVTASNLKAGSTTAAGDNDIALGISALTQTVFSAPPDSISGTFSGFYSKTVSNIGEALSTANAKVDDQTSIQKLVSSQRDGVSGVSLDEETADLMKYQRAFEASSRVFSVVDSLLDTVVNRMGA